MTDRGAMDAETLEALADAIEALADICTSRALASVRAGGTRLRAGGTRLRAAVAAGGKALAQMDRAGGWQAVTKRLRHIGALRRRA